MEKSEIYGKMQQAVMEGDKDKARQAATQALEAKLDPRQAIEEGFSPAIKKMGELWEEGEAFLPELVMSAEAMKEGIEVLKPEMAKRQESAPNLGTVVIGTIHGDIHDIGKSLVAALLAAVGFKVFDLGVDVPAEKFVEEAKAHNADIIGISALLTTTMPGQKKVIELLNAQGIRSRFKVLVGGAPISKKWAQDIGADSAPMGALEAVQTARSMMAVKA
jgi:corrinoid protein of di/trimethylamine methyltransferase